MKINHPWKSKFVFYMIKSILYCSNLIITLHLFSQNPLGTSWMGKWVLMTLGGFICLSKSSPKWSIKDKYVQGMSGVDKGALTHPSSNKNLVISIDEACIEMCTWWYWWRSANFQKWNTDNCWRSLAHLSISIVLQKIHYLLYPCCALTQRQTLDQLFSTGGLVRRRGHQQISVGCKMT